MAGVPVTSIFAGIFERLGFTIRLPYTFTGVIGNPASLSTGEKLTRLVRRIWGMAVLPLGEDMDHVINNYKAIEDDLSMIYYYEYIERKNKENVLIINKISNSQFRKSFELDNFLNDNKMANKEKLTISR